DDVDMALCPRAPQAELFGAVTDVGDADRIEAGLDAAGEILEHRLGDAAGVVGRPVSRAAALDALAERDGPLQSAHHVAQADVSGAARQAISALRTTFAADDAGALQVLKNLLQEPRRDRLTLGDVLDLGGAPVVRSEERRVGKECRGSGAEYH